MIKFIVEYWDDAEGCQKLRPFNSQAAAMAFLLGLPAVDPELEQPKISEWTQNASGKWVEVEPLEV